MLPEVTQLTYAFLYDSVLSQPIKPRKWKCYFDNRWAGDNSSVLVFPRLPDQWCQQCGVPDHWTVGPCCPTMWLEFELETNQNILNFQICTVKNQA